MLCYKVDLYLLAQCNNFVAASLKNNDKLLELVRSLQNQFQISVPWGCDDKINPAEIERCCNWNDQIY